MVHRHSAPIQIQTWQDPESPAIARPVFNTVSYLAFYKSYIQCTPDLVTHLVCQKTVTKSRGVTK